ncbi:MAG: S9 family peptidase [Pedobacter sp.]|nr:MAG: S9 family peptidase [Pedobacter sp.]
MKKRSLVFAILMLCPIFLWAQNFNLKSALEFPFPSELTTSPKSNKMAWAMNEMGKRNVYIAEGPNFSPRKITEFNEDDGQEISGLTISEDGNWLVFVRGGDHSSREASVPVQAASMPVPQKVQIMSIPFSGGRVNILAEGDQAHIFPDSKQVLFSKGGQFMVVPIDGTRPARQYFYARGNNTSPQWSPDGKKLAFVSQRDTHAFIGIFQDDSTPIQWLLPAFAKDNSPRWSPDGNEIAFIRTPASGGAPDSILKAKSIPWSIWRVNVALGVGKSIWTAKNNPESNIPSVTGGANLLWAQNKLIFTSYQDKWPHLYAIDTDGNNETLLTPGNFMVEHVKLSPDKRKLLFSANTGKDKHDLDRRHLYQVSIDKPDMEALTFGEGIQVYPQYIGNMQQIAFLSSTAQRPLLPSVLNIPNKKTQILGENLIPEGFPLSQMITPTAVQFKAPDGGTIYAQLFTPKSGPRKKPAIVYVHGGPQRQMLLGWHYMDYYAYNYALNQYLASQGYVVLSVNYRLGIGYGYDFHKPPYAGAQGASEYQDIKAAGDWLAKQNNVDDDKIGIYGGSYGGYLVALALGKDSKRFAVGVDIHGVNNRFNNPVPDREPAPDAAEAARKLIEASPLTYLATWTSPTLLIHADDDRNVAFSQSSDLARRFEQKKFPYEYLVIPDDTHHWMKFSNLVKVSEATASFLHKILSQPKKK